MGPPLHAELAAHSSRPRRSGRVSLRNLLVRRHCRSEPRACADSEKASERDVPLILSFILKLAEYERKAHEVVSTEEDLRDALFGERPVAEALLAYTPGHSNEEPVGFALYFSRPIQPSAVAAGFSSKICSWSRGIAAEGFGTALLAAVARLAQERGGWLQWLVLDWNEPAVEFYRRLGATRIDEWNSYKLQGDALKHLAGG